ncbi:MAG: NfeD family protein [Verrucomicrobiota bacterium]
MELIITLLAVGVILILLETILPGLIAGIVGFCCLIAGIYFAYARFGAQTGHWVLSGVTVGLIIGALCWLRYFPNSRLARPLVSQSVGGDIGADQPELLAQTGVALTTLRPSGTAVIDGKRVDVVTEGALIEKGVSIKVVGIEGLRVIVRAV